MNTESEPTNHKNIFVHPFVWYRHKESVKKNKSKWDNYECIKTMIFTWGNIFFCGLVQNLLVKFTYPTEYNFFLI